MIDIKCVCGHVKHHHRYDQNFESLAACNFCKCKKFKKEIHK